MARPTTLPARADDQPDVVANTPLLPDFGGGCITEIVPTLLQRSASPGEAPPWVPPGVLEARQVVLFVLDGLGWTQLDAHREELPTIASLTGGPITSVLPTTTATALTSLATGAPPAEHGVVGYRVRADDGVLNILKWITDAGDARTSIIPRDFQPIAPFLGTVPPIVSRAEFEGSGFTNAHLGTEGLVGWRMPSAIVVEVVRLLKSGAPFIYLYYDGIDKVAHDKGLGEHYCAELRAVDRLVADLCATLPEHAALCLTADHGQVEVNEPPITLDPQIAAQVEMLSGEGRFRWLHVKEARLAPVREACEEFYGDVAWVRTRHEMELGGWFGGELSETVASRLGDVALIARAPVAFFDPFDTGELRLVARHGSATKDELYVPFLAQVT